MGYLSSKEISDIWRISDRRIRVLCSEGRIEGAVKIGRNWSMKPKFLSPTYLEDNKSKDNKSTFSLTRFKRYKGLKQINEGLCRKVLPEIANIARVVFGLT